MKKTTNILFEFMRQFTEQDEPEQPPQGDTPEQPASTTTDISSNERYIIKLLTNAFIFNPSIFDENKQQYIENKIKYIFNLVNVPISKIIDEIKSVIALDISLRMESRTNNLFEKYFKLIEQIADGTEPQPGKNNIQLTKQQDTTPVPENENSISLEEIFPLYKELMLKSLSHIPSDDELMILKPVAKELGEVDPSKIVTTIKNLLSQSIEDKEVMDDLSNA